MKLRGIIIKVIIEKREIIIIEGKLFNCFNIVGFLIGEMEERK